MKDSLVIGKQPLTMLRWRYKRKVQAGNKARSSADWQNAYDNYRAALRLFPNAAPVWVQCGHAAKEMGNFAAAEEAYRTADRLQPGDADLQVQFGHLFKETGRHAEAVFHYKAAVAAGSTDVNALDYLFRDAMARADAAREEGQLKLAAVLYQEAADIRAEYAILMQIGTCLISAGDIGGAERAYLSALALQPDDPECRRLLEQLRPSTDNTNHQARVVMPNPRKSQYGHLSENVAVIRERLRHLHNIRPL